MILRGSTTTYIGVFWNPGEVYRLQAMWIPARTFRYNIVLKEHLSLKGSDEDTWSFQLPSFLLCDERQHAVDAKDTLFSKRTSSCILLETLPRSKHQDT